MAPVRVAKTLREAFKGTVPKVGTSSTRLGSSKSLHESPFPQVIIHAQSVPTDRTSIKQATKKLRSRLRRTSRFGDHGSSSAFKKALRRRERANMAAPGFPSSSLPIPHGFQSQSLSQHQMPATVQPPVSPRPTDPRQTVRESRFAEKHMGVPFGVYLACKSLNSSHRGPVKSVERHGRETRRERFVVLAWAKGSPFRGCKRRSVFMQPSDVFVLGAVFDGYSEIDSQPSPPRPKVGCDVEEVQPLPLAAVITISQAPSTELSDEMEDILPAPLIYRQSLSQLVPSLPLVPTRTLAVPASPVQAMHACPPSSPSLAFTLRSPVIQPPSPAPSPGETRHAQLVQLGQVLPTMSYFCRNLTRVAKEMASALQALGSVRARDRCALPPTTPVAFKTRPSCPCAASVWLPPPAPTKARRAYVRPSAVYESDG